MSTPTESAVGPRGGGGGRAPPPHGVVRFGFPALYTRFVDVFDAAQRTRDLVEQDVQRSFSAERSRVT